MTAPLITADETKACCSAAYSSGFATMLLGRNLHPGGEALTLRLAELAGIQPGMRVLDVACGRGASALLLARELNCQVIGVDLSPESVADAASAAETERLSERTRFLVGDAEELRFVPGSFDAVICECALCTFPDKAAALEGMYRVLRPGAAIGIADLVRHGPLPPELDGLAAWIACIADAQTSTGYRTLLEVAGFELRANEKHDAALLELVSKATVALVAMRVISGHRGGRPPFDLDAADALARGARHAIDSGRLGYELFTAVRPC